MRLRTFLVLAMVSLLVTTVILVAGTSFFNAQRSAETLSAEVLSQAAYRIELRVRSQLDIATSVSALAVRRFERGELRPDDFERLTRFEVDVLASHPSLTHVAFVSDATGEIAQATRASATEIHARFLRRKGDAMELSTFAVEGDHFRPLSTVLAHQEPRQRPYYLAVRAANHPIWTETYPFFSEQSKLTVAGVTFATPIAAADGSLAGVLTADFDLGGMSEFLKDLDLFAHGAAFIVEYRADGARTVIAHPNPEKLVAKGRAGNAPAAVRLEEIDDPRLVAFGAALPATADGIQAGGVEARFASGGARFIGSSRRVGGRAPRWVVGVFTPESDVLGGVEKNNRTTAIIVLLSTALAVALALWLGGMIARPLRAVADETEQIGQFKLDTGAPAATSIVEVARLSAAVEEMKRNLRSFRKYVPAEVVRELVAEGVEAELGGRRATLTIHFSDIAGFTSIAETVPPEDLVMMLGEYLDEMTRPILDSGGTVDKFIGDAIMAFWGAPRSDADHALHACEAALANRARLDVLNAKWEAAGRPRLDARAALHTGDVIVGNIGSHQRLDYTVIGDSVNLASRMEGLNKEYGTRLMISEQTYALVKDVLLARPLDRVSVKGKTKSIEVYELIGRRSEIAPSALDRAERHTKAFTHYLAGRFDVASGLFAALAEEREGDKAAQLLKARCDELMTAPPGPGWDGSIQMTSK